MPAHKSLAAAARSTKSDGIPVTQTEWRANRLADAVAKAAAAAAAPATAVTTEVGQAMRLLMLEAAVVGATTHAANHHPVVRAMVDGTEGSTMKRDSVTPKREAQRPYGPRRTRPGLVPLPPPPSARVAPPTVGKAKGGKRAIGSKSAARAEAAARAAKRRRLDRAAADLALREAVRVRHEEDAASPRYPSPSPERVRAFAAGLTADEPCVAAAAGGGETTAVDPAWRRCSRSRSRRRDANAAGHSSAPAPAGVSAEGVAARPPRGPRSCSRDDSARGARTPPSLAALVAAHTRAYAPRRPAAKLRPSMRVPRLPFG